MIQERIRFKNRKNYELTGIVQLPDRKPNAFALFAHCFTCSKNIKAVGHIADSLVKSGIGVLRFDFTGLGESEGEFSDTNFSSNIEDINDACEYLKNNFMPPSILIGHSLGGAAVLHAAGDIKSCKAVVTIASPSSPEHIIRHFRNSEEIDKKGVAEVNIAGRSFNIKKQFVDNLKEQKLIERVKNLNKAILILHSPFDNVVGIDNASEIFLAAKHPKSYISLDNADHMLSNPADSSYVGFVIASWVKKYTDKINDEQDDVFPSLDGNDVAVSTKLSGYFSTINASGHYLFADEPIKFGGTENGPTPYDLLLASLGSCVNMTLKMYADRKEIPLENVITRLSHKKVHAEDCEDCETNEGKIDYIEKEIELKGDISEDQLDRLLYISEKCPVHKTLKSEVSITSKIKK
ncbi:MAG: bifunctional alpha/beta hydrolase/OsmC family protein [Thermodesulfobacteriota bacterium]